VILSDVLGELMPATVLYELFDKGKKGEALKQTEQEARAFLEKAFVLHKAKSRSVTIETDEIENEGYETTLYVVRNTAGQVVANYRLINSF
jgi:hypothetical protein